MAETFGTQCERIPTEVQLMKEEKLLVAIDDHSSSLDAVKYVGKITAGERDLTVCVLQLLPPLVFFHRSKKRFIPT
jgi:hypothetical protein